MQFMNYQVGNPRVDYFYSDDSYKSYKKNRKTQSSDWIYHKKILKYKINKDSFREKEFDKITWRNSIVFFGCSYTFGLGLAEEDTIPKKVQRLLDIPCVNLGICGAAIDLSLFNSTILFNYFPKPRAIVHLWTHFGRYTNILKPQKNVMAVRYLPQGTGYVKTVNWELRDPHYVEAERAIWKNIVPRYEASFCKDTASELNIDYIPHLDYARDMAHPGIKSASLAAEKIAENLKLSL